MEPNSVNSVTSVHRTSDDVKEKVYESQLLKISELVDDPLSTESTNKNYGIIPLNALHNIMLFQRLQDLLSMSLSCSLFYRLHNSSYFWKSYYRVYFKKEIIPQNNDYVVEHRQNQKVNWKKEFFKRLFVLVYTWGHGESVSLGHGNTKMEVIPKLVENLVPYKIRNMHCGKYACCSVVLSNGSLLSWGRNNDNRLGRRKDEYFIPSSDKILSPECLIQIPENRKIIQVAHGDCTSFFLDDVGDVWGCGSNSTGCLTGKESYESVKKPVKILISESPIIKKIACGPYHFGCISSSGNLYTFGDGYLGRLGHGDEEDVLQTRIVKYFSERNIRVKDISMGGDFSVVLSEDGKLYSFGGNDFGQLGNGETSEYHSPELLKHFEDNSIVVKRISCGASHSGCIDSIGNCYMWGYATFGEIGNGTFEKEKIISPIRIRSFIDYSGERVDLDIPNRHKFVLLECGFNHNIAVLEESVLLSSNERKTINFVLVWGNGMWGQLGLNHQGSVNIPTVVPFFEKKTVKYVKAGEYMSVVIL